MMQNNEIEYQGDEPPYLSALNPEQYQAVKHEGSPLLIIAGAGSGKTRVITTKIAYLIAKRGVDARQILAVTFTKKAAAEMRERAVALEPRADGAQLRTFHSFGAWFLRVYGAAADRMLSDSFTVYDDKDVVSLLMASVASLDNRMARSAARCIALAKDYCLTPEDDLTGVCGDWDVDKFTQVYQAYQAALRQSGNADFGDLIMLPALMLERNEDLAQRMYRRFRVIMVDEYQDSNIAQSRLLRALAGDVRETQTYVCAVGDDDQSIYKFRGAEVQNILGFANAFPGTQTIQLTRNYRSTARILQAAGNVVAHNTDRLAKTMSAERGDGNAPMLVYLNSGDEEAATCADMIMQWVRGGAAGSYSDWAILYRSNAQSRTFETEFMKRQIPYVVVGTLKFLDREEVKDILSYMAFMLNGNDQVAFRRVVNKPRRGVGDKTVDAVMKIADDRGITVMAAAKSAAIGGKAGAGLSEFASVIDDAMSMLAVTGGDGSGAKLSALVEKVAVRSGLMEYYRGKDEDESAANSGEVHERESNIYELSNAAASYECSMAGLLAFMDDVALSEAGDDARLSQTSGGAGADNMQNESGKAARGGAVTLITIHNTKGLEFDRVVLTGVETGVFPHGDEDMEHMAEERRLFYVGATRARNYLCVTTCSQRFLYGHLAMMTPSRFIAEAGDVFTVVDRRVAVRYGYAARSVVRDGTLEAKWQRGTKVYSDEWGYGYVTSCIKRNNEVVITVRFAGGAVQRFMPEYQAAMLTIVDEG